MEDFSEVAELKKEEEKLNARKSLFSVSWANQTNFSSKVSSKNMQNFPLGASNR